MDKAEFIAKFKDVLQRDEEINEEMHLDDIIEYDSMSQLNVVVLIDTEFGILITPEDLDECEKVKDIILLLGDNVI
jgi:acyl carrier protein|tara:strand:+ start:146 stop:373 length:228 start_codon:yes stop_codon:yes gene_type:complete